MITMIGQQAICFKVQLLTSKPCGPSCGTTLRSRFALTVQSQRHVCHFYVSVKFWKVYKLKRDCFRPDLSRYVAATVRFFRQHTKAYGVDNFRPKHHGLFDLALQVERDRFFLDCWTLERKNLATKKACDEVDSLHNYELTCMKRILAVTFTRNHSFKDGLVEPTNSQHFGFLSGLLHGATNVVVAASCRCKTLSFTVGDLLMISARLYRVEACCIGDDVLYLMTMALEHVSKVSRSCARFRETAEFKVFRADDQGIAPATAWRKCGQNGGFDVFDVLGV
jgi:hypothetical protein